MHLLPLIVEARNFGAEALGVRGHRRAAHGDCCAGPWPACAGAPAARGRPACMALAPWRASLLARSWASPAVEMARTANRRRREIALKVAGARIARRRANILAYMKVLRPISIARPHLTARMCKYARGGNGRAYMRASSAKSARKREEAMS